MNRRELNIHESPICSILINEVLDGLPVCEEDIRIFGKSALKGTRYSSPIPKHLIRIKLNITGESSYQREEDLLIKLDKRIRETFWGKGFEESALMKSDISFPDNSFLSLGRWIIKTKKRAYIIEASSTFGYQKNGNPIKLYNSPSASSSKGA